MMQHDATVIQHFSPQKNTENFEISPSIFFKIENIQAENNVQIRM